MPTQRAIELLTKEAVSRLATDTESMIKGWQKWGRRFNHEDHALITQCLHNQVFMLNTLAGYKVTPDYDDQTE